MTTEETKATISYGSIVRNLLALRDEVSQNSREEAEAIERIVSDVMALQMSDGYFSQKAIANTRN